MRYDPTEQIKGPNYKKKCIYQCEKNNFTVGINKMKMKTVCAYFFKCSFIKRVASVIFEFNEVSISNWLYFQFQRMTLKSERVFERKKKHFISKTGQKGYEFSYQKGPQQMKNFLHE